MNISEFMRAAIKTPMTDLQILMAAKKAGNWTEEETLKRAGYPKYYRAEARKAEKVRAAIRAEIEAEAK